uniref:HLA class II histocompatibility antigen, DR alpha chain-like n=1 Tax=Sander lucioperca TaxID=283035 RepID=A0A8C9XYN9_SANLU
MKMMMILVLSGLLCVSADVLHEDIYINGCSDSDGESMYALDGEEKWVADHINKRGVEPQPSFVDHIRYPRGFYEQAVTGYPAMSLSPKPYNDFYEQFYPQCVIYTTKSVQRGKKNTLICYVTGFYPAPVNFYWTKNGENVTQGTSTNVPYPNKDGSFNQFSRLEFIPQLGDIYSCTVKHLALDQPLTRIWDVEKTQPGIGPAVFCGLGLTVGLLGVATGTFFLIKGNKCS